MNESKQKIIVHKAIEKRRETLNEIYTNDLNER